MILRMGGQTFWNVEIPLLWGNRAVLKDEKGRLSVIDLSGPVAKLEIVGDQPAEGVEFAPTVEGFKIFVSGIEQYRYNPADKTLVSASSKPPKCQILPDSVRIGESAPIGPNEVCGCQIGLVVTENGMVGLGAALPENLARLMI
jgi:hypothetical protein